LRQNVGAADGDTKLPRGISMRQLKWFIVALIAPLMLSSLVPLAASATTALPEIGLETKLSGEGTAAVFQSAKGEVKCKSSVSSGSATTHKVATLTTTFHECSWSGSKCETSGSAEGTVSLASEVLLVSLTSKTAGVWLLVKEATITCGVLKVKVKGNVLGSIGPLEKLASSFEVTLKLGKELGTQEDTEFLNDAGEKVKAKLEVNFGIGFEKGALEAAGVKLKPATETEISFDVPDIVAFPESSDLGPLRINRESAFQEFVFKNEGPGVWIPGPGEVFELIEPAGSSGAFTFLLPTSPCASAGTVAEHGTCRTTVELAPRFEGDYAFGLWYNFSPAVELTGEGTT
jgi:hypothetical protein